MVPAPRWASLLVVAGCSIPAARGPELPAEYRPLEMLLGDWEASSRAEFAASGRVLLVRATVEADWDLDRRFVVARSGFSFTDAATGERLPPSTSVSWFTWDAKRGRYAYWTFQSGGAVAAGTMRFDPSTNIWSMEETGVDDATGRPVVTGRGSMEYRSATEKIVRWHSHAGGFRSEGRSRRVRAR